MNDDKPATSHWLFQMDLRVWDPRQLHAAACRRMQEEDDPADELLATYAIRLQQTLGTADEPDIAACLGMMLDPGSLAGCSIGNHSAEQMEAL